jgi:alkylhydroperoxidase family enzyme
MAPCGCADARKVVQSPNTTTEEDMASLRRAGLSDQEIFDATVFVAFRLAFSTVNDALGASPDRQLAQRAPDVVLRAVKFGRAVDAEVMGNDLPIKNA